MIYTQNDLLKLILDTHAVSIWDPKKGPVFWFAANVPGPFYVNTEKVIGEALSERLLREITAIVAGDIDPEARAEQLDRLILEAFKKNPGWQKLISTMADRAQNDIPPKSYAYVSGGERRDWLFSIPFAHANGVPHLFLFKNKTMFCKQPVKAGQGVLHVSDLIHHASSFFESWQPLFQKAHLTCCGNLCVNVRGEKGLKHLQEAGQKVVALVKIDPEFFRRLHADNLVSREAFEELAVFCSSAQDWAIKYLIGRPELFDVKDCDAKKLERMSLFFANDPWNLRPQYKDFFALMQKAIHQRAGGVPDRGVKTSGTSPR